MGLHWTQVAALFACTVISLIPTLNFSGLLVPVASLSGAARVGGLGFPAAWFQPLTVGIFDKALGFADLWFNLLVIAGFGLFFLIAAHTVLRKQEA